MIISKFENFFIFNFLKNFEKTSYLGNYKNLSSQIQKQDSQPPESTLTDSNNRIEMFKDWNLLTYKSFLKISEKIIKNVISRKLQGFEQSHLAAKFATPESTLTESHYRDGNFNFVKLIVSNFSEN